MPTRTCTAKDCTQKNGEPSICVNNQCVKLKSPECQDVGGALDNDDAIVFGTLVSLTGSDAVSGKTRTHSARLATDEINKPGGVLTADGCGHRPLIHVGCDDANTALPNDAGTGNRVNAAKHLIDLGAVAIIGGNTSGNSVDVFNNATHAAREILMPPSSTAAELSGSSLDGGTEDGVRLMWRMVPDDSIQGQALKTVYDEVVKELNGKGRTTLKVAIIARQDPYGLGNLDFFTKNIDINGKPYLDAANSANHIERTYATTATVPASVITDVRTFNPDIILEFGLGEFSTQIMTPYEDGLGAATPPMWLSTTSAQRGDLLTALKTHPLVKPRIRGVTNLLVTPLAQDFFNFRYKAAYPGDSASLLGGMSNVYDAVYMIAYAAAETKLVLPGTAIKSEEIGRQFANIINGATTVDVGPAGLGQGMQTASKGTPFKLNGSSSPLNFDPATGQLTSDHAVWCIGTDPNTGDPIYNNTTGQIWHIDTKSLTGTFSCP